jgi:hypothetical protein
MFAKKMFRPLLVALFLAVQDAYPLARRIEVLTQTRLSPRISILQS